MADGQKTEKATPKKRRDERKKGDVFFSNDAVSVAVLVVGIAVLALSAPAAGRRIQAFFRLCISMAGAGENQAFSDGGALLKAFWRPWSGVQGRCWALKELQQYL